jgi:choline dehydrogenase-like flavoprotein
VRATVANTYLEQAASRPNLFILTDAIATKINFDSEVASSVEFSAQGSKYTVKVGKELILAAGQWQEFDHLPGSYSTIGPIRTPQLLELSGVGNKTLLESYGINAILDLPAVGENLQVCIIGAPLYFQESRLSTGPSSDLARILCQLRSNHNGYAT